MTTNHLHTSMTPLDIVKWLLSRNIRQVMLMVVLMVAVAPLGTMATPGNNGGPGNSGAAKQCQKGGWQQLARADDPAATFANQGDCVGYGAQGGVVVPLDSDLDGSSDVSDCAPYNPAVSPLLPEVQDGIDNDCDGQVDEGLVRLQIVCRDISGYVGCQIIVRVTGLPPREPFVLELNRPTGSSDLQLLADSDGTYTLAAALSTYPCLVTLNVKVYGDSSKTELLAEAPAELCG